MVTPRSMKTLLVLCALVSLPAPALAQGAPQPEQQPEPQPEPAPASAPAPAGPVQQLTEPRLHHAPISVAQARADLHVRADIEHPHLVRRALLVYRLADEPGFRELEFRRASDGPYVAIVPAEELAGPSLSYLIELERLDGVRTSAFGSRAAPHRVVVPEDLMDARERALYQRLGGRRTVFAAFGEVVSYGKSEGVNRLTGVEQNVQDWHYRIEGSFTYRLLRVIPEFGIRGGHLRGKAPVSPNRERPPGTKQDSFKVGMDYGAPRVRFRATDIVHLEGELIVGFTETGFAWGGGGAVLLGDPYGSKLTLGFDSLEQFGSRFYSRMDMVVAEGYRVAPIIEVTNTPSSEVYGVRLLAEIGADVGEGFSLAVRGGYQARTFSSGGPSGGLLLAYAF
jgi:hypothetical protein